MGKLILLSLLGATVAIPVLCARDPSPHRGLKRMLFFLFLFIAVYVALVAYVYPPLSPLPPEALR